MGLCLSLNIFVEFVDVNSCAAPSALNKIMLAKEEVVSYRGGARDEYEYRMFVWMGVLMVLFVCVALRLLEYYYKDEHIVEEKFVETDFRSRSSSTYGAIEGSGFV